MPVLVVNEGQQVDPAGTVTDVYEITFTIAGHPGSFNITVPKGGDAVAAAEQAINAEASTVNALYGL